MNAVTPLWFFLCACAGMAAILVVAAKKYPAPAQTFRVGMCIQQTTKSLQTYKIEMIRGRNYLLRKYPENIWRTSIGFYLPITEANNWIEVHCTK